MNCTVFPYNLPSISCFYQSRSIWDALRPKLRQTHFSLQLPFYTKLLSELFNLRRSASQIETSLFLLILTSKSRKKRVVSFSNTGGKNEP